MHENASTKEKKKGKRVKRGKKFDDIMIEHYFKNHNGEVLDSLKEIFLLYYNEYRFPDGIDNIFKKRNFNRIVIELLKLIKTAKKIKDEDQNRISYYEKTYGSNGNNLLFFDDNENFIRGIYNINQTEMQRQINKLNQSLKAGNENKADIEQIYNYKF